MVVALVEERIGGEVRRERFEMDREAFVPLHLRVVVARRPGGLDEDDPNATVPCLRRSGEQT